jgi:thioredoxin reductase
VTTASGRQFEADAAWVAMKWKAASDLAASLCEVDEVGVANVDSNGKTSRPGVFAVGNAADPIAHLAQATAEGTNVGPHVTNYLLELKISELASRKESLQR